MPEFDQLLGSLASAASSAAHGPDAAAIRARSGRMRNRRRVAYAIAVAVAVAGIGVLATQAFPRGIGPAPLTTPSPSVVPSASPSPVAVSPSPSLRAVVKPCQAADVSIAWGQEDSGSTHRSAPVVLTYKGTGECTLKGYPKVTGDLPGQGTQTARHTKSGYLGGLAGDAIPSLTLSSRRPTASALVEGMAFDQATTLGCGTYSTVSVTLPGDTQPMSLPSFASDVCSALEVHPFVAGDSGRG